MKPKAKTRFPSYFEEEFDYADKRPKPAVKEKRRRQSVHKHASLKSPWFFIIFFFALYGTLRWEPIVNWNNRFLGRAVTAGNALMEIPLEEMASGASPVSAAPKPPGLSFWFVVLAILEAYVIATWVGKRRNLPLLALKDPYYYFLALLEQIEGNKLSLQLRDLAATRSKKLARDVSVQDIGFGKLLRATFWWWAFAFLAHRSLTYWLQSLHLLHVNLFGEAVSELLALFEARWIASYLTPRRSYFVHYFRFIRKTLFSGPQGILLTSTIVAAYITVRLIPLLFAFLYSVYSGLSNLYPFFALFGVTSFLVLGSFATGLAIMVALNTGLLALFSFSLSNSIYTSLLGCISSVFFGSGSIKHSVNENNSKSRKVA